MRLALLEILHALFWAFAIIVASALWGDKTGVNIPVWGIIGFVISSSILLAAFPRRNPPR